MIKVFYPQPIIENGHNFSYADEFRNLLYRSILVLIQKEFLSMSC